MFKKIIALVAGALLGLLVGATFNSALANGPKFVHSNSVAGLTRGDDPVCTVTRIAPQQFLTAGHCVASEDSLFVTHDGNTATVDYITRGLGSDWAVVHTSTDIDTMSSMALSCEASPYLGQDVVTMGYPYPMQRQYTRGYISAFQVDQRHDFEVDYFLVMPGIGGGSSGSAVVDPLTGGIIGILVSAVPTPRFGGILAVGIQGLDVNGLCKK